MTFRLCCRSFAHRPELLFFVSFFDLTGEVSQGRNGKSNDVPNVREGAWYRCGDGGYGCSQQLCFAPGASKQLLEEMQLFPTLPHRFPLVPGTRCYLGPLLSPVWLLSTLSERALSTFLRFTTLSVSFQPLLFPSVTL